MSIYFTEEESQLIKEGKKLFPGEGVGFNYDEWNSVIEWKKWLVDKITIKKKKQAEVQVLNTIDK